MEEKFHIDIQIRSDEKGYFDRQCPNGNCNYFFKIKLRDWKDKVSDDEVHCPMCGHVDVSTEWNTPAQREAFKQRALAALQGKIFKMFDDTFGKIARSTQNNKYFRVTYKPGKRITFDNNPIGQSEEWENEIVCSECGTGYSVIGSAYFCPCCGFNSVETAFDNSLNSIEKKLASLPEIRGLLANNYSEDDAENICRSMQESAIGDIVSAFQKMACSRYNRLSGCSAKPNDFQVIDRGSQFFYDKFGRSYLDFISADEYDFLGLMFQRRHIVEHNDGFVDQRYLDKSGDTSYVVGQRLVIKKEDIDLFLRLVRKLGAGLITIQPNP